MIEQEPFCGVRTHFYHNASSYDMFRDRRVVEAYIQHCTVQRRLLCSVCSPLFYRTSATRKPICKTQNFFAHQPERFVVLPYYLASLKTLSWTASCSNRRKKSFGAIHFCKKYSSFIRTHAMIQIIKTQHLPVFASVHRVHSFKSWWRSFSYT